jgi:hypothetical protein
VGFELASKLNWKSHITSKCQATQRLIHALGKCLRLTWGIDTVKLLTLYKAIIFPKILYGVSVWCHSTLKKYVTKNLLSVQRTMLELITRSFKSVPTTSMLILANLLPINLTALELSYTRKLSFINLAYTPSSLKAIGKVLPEIKTQTQLDNSRKYFSPNHPPWSTWKLDYINAPSPLPLLSSNSETLHIYVGVTKTEGGIGVAIACCSQKEVVYTEKESISYNTTTVQAKLHGLHLALRYAQANRDYYKKYNIFTASNTALNICTRDSKISNTAKLCRDLFQELYGEVILNLMSQASTEGSTTAILLAKEAI